MTEELMSRPTLALAVLLAVTAPLHAQERAPTPTVGLPLYLLDGYSTLRLHLTQAAEKMAAEDYRFRPGSMSDARTFGEVIAHVASSQTATCAAARGLPDPNAGRPLERELDTKAELTEALADSFALCDLAFTGLTDAAVNEVIVYGPAEITRGALLAYTLVHSSEMYGISTVYLRSRGILPPSTERERAAAAR